MNTLSTKYLETKFDMYFLRRWKQGFEREVFIELIENKNIQEEIKIFLEDVDIVMMLFN